MQLSTVDVALSILVIILAVVAFAFWFKVRRTAGLKSRFGQEYRRTVDGVGDQGKAEALLHQREVRVKKFDIHPLSFEKRDRFIGIWKSVQADFVDDPNGALTHADDLLGDVMESRGYPVADFDQRSEDLSVDHPEVVQNYRIAHDIALRNSRGEASTEDLRQAMLHYRALFDDLVNEPDAGRPEEGRVSQIQREKRHG
jgi:hypothetical protein